MNPAAAAAPAVALAARGIDKAFAGVHALRGVDFEVRAGEVVALVGENGAGKSTLLQILSGSLAADAGQVRVDGEAVTFRGPADAMARGIARVAQEPQQCLQLSIAAAVFLGAELRRGWLLDDAAMVAASRTLLARLGLDVDPQQPVGSLATGQRQLLEIARALRAEAKVLILDEPTSSLTDVEAERLFAIVDDLRAAGTAIVYVSHRLGEVQRLADRVVGLRDGRNSGELARDQISHQSIVGLMVGREFAHATRQPRAPGEVLLSVRGLVTSAWPQARVDLQVRAGEVVGVAGLLGAGRSEILRALFGVDAPLAGTIEVAGQPLHGRGPAAAAAAGLALVPEDRQHQGLVLGHSVADNLSLPTLHRRGWRVAPQRERELAAHWCRELDVRAASPALRVGSLSGGNQQKVVLGKWLAAAPRVLLLDEPTRGVDVGARGEIYARLDALAAAGLAVLFVSSELEEVFALADRVLVVHQGRITGALPRDRFSEQTIMLLATGQSLDSDEVPA
ncbi:MAG: sugar ABC transporter ATP-binding protein [Planctomycetes bacterium]|nr:sugar ABC transporter ATP-binding protein [Planctomycetota bacterium]